MDDCDLAILNDRFFNQQAINKHLNRGAAPETVFDVCMDCGEDIPDARKKAVPGCCRCVACQTLKEQR